MKRSLYHCCSLFLLFTWSALAVAVPFQVTHSAQREAVLTLNNSQKPCSSCGESPEKSLAFELDLETEDFLLDDFGTLESLPVCLLPLLKQELRLPWVYYQRSMPPDKISP